MVINASLQHISYIIVDLKSTIQTISFLYIYIHIYIYIYIYK